MVLYIFDMVYLLKNFLKFFLQFPRLFLFDSFYPSKAPLFLYLYYINAFKVNKHNTLTEIKKIIYYLKFLSLSMFSCILRCCISYIVSVFVLLPFSDIYCLTYSSAEYKILFLSNSLSDSASTATYAG